MSNLNELRSLRGEIMRAKGLTTPEAVDWIAGALMRSPLTVWGWLNKSQLTPISDNLLTLLRYKVNEISITDDA